MLQIVLRTINSSLSAYLSVTYNADFFDSYDVLDCTVVQAGLLMKVLAELQIPDCGCLQSTAVSTTALVLPAVLACYYSCCLCFPFPPAACAVSVSHSESEQDTV